jgi:hypothetical protein
MRDRPRSRSVRQPRSRADPTTTVLARNRSICRAAECAGGEDGLRHRRSPGRTPDLTRRGRGKPRRVAD